MKFASYPAYRTSQIEWMQTVPVDWDECSAKINFLMQVGKMLQNDPAGLEDIEITYLKALHVNWNRVTTEDLPKMWASPSDLKQYTVSNDDLLVCEGGEVGRAAILKKLDESAIIQNALHRVRGTERGDVRYFAYLLKHIADAGWFAILCNKATIAHLTGDKLGAIYMPVPTVPEQQQIAAFLDWKTGQIDALIARKKDLLEKLKEKRRAVITQAVTKGLDSDVPMRESGNPLIGFVPKHWDLKRLRFLVDAVEQGWSPKASNIAAEEGEMGVLKLSAVSCGDFVPQENKFLEEIPENQTIQTPRKYDILITRANTPERVGDACSIRDDFPNLIIPDLIYRLKVDRVQSDERFLVFYLISKQGRAQIEAQARGSSESMVKLGQGHLKDFQIPSPPLQEQNEIVEFIDTSTNRLDQMAEKVAAVIDRLTEYRTALITAATTGKIDVRKVKIPAAKPAAQTGRK
jgi:type I restriction enzyme S subunit